MIYKVTIFGLIIINLINWLDGVLTYIGLYILPIGIFYEKNLYALNKFNTIGFFSYFIFKICICLFVTLSFFLLIHNKKLSALMINYFTFLSFLVLTILTIPVIQWGVYLTSYYIYFV